MSKKSLTTLKPAEAINSSANIQEISITSTASGEVSSVGSTQHFVSSGTTRVPVSITTITGETRWTSTTMNVDISVLLHNQQVFQQKIDELETLVHSLQPKVVEIRDVSLEEAQSLIADYLEKKERGFPSDIADALGISLEVTAQALEKLKEQGVVKRADDSLSE